MPCSDSLAPKLATVEQALLKIARVDVLQGKKKKEKRKHLRYDVSRNVNAQIGTTNAELYTTLDVRYLYYRGNLCETKDAK